MLDFSNPIDFYIASHSTKAWRRKYKNYSKQVELVANDLIDYNGIDNIKAQVAPIINGVNSDNNDIRAENEEKLVDFVHEIADSSYYDYFSRYYSIENHKNDFYKACMFADYTNDNDEWTRVRIGFERVVEDALYKIAE